MCTAMCVCGDSKQSERLSATVVCRCLPALRTIHRDVRGKTGINVTKTRPLVLKQFRILSEGK